MRPKVEPVDPDTGLPTLPEGMRWKIGKREGESYDWSDCYKGFGISVREGLSVVRRSEVINEDHEVAIARSARGMAAQIWSEYKAKIAHDAAVDRLSGEYPPRKFD